MQFGKGYKCNFFLTQINKFILVHKSLQITFTTIKFITFVSMNTKEKQLEAIVEYIEQAGLTFTEPFSLISATVVEASYHTGISKNTILVHINRTFKEKYGEKYIKAQKIAHEIACGNNPDEEKILSMDFSKQLQPKEPKDRKQYEFRKDKSEYKPKKTTTEFGRAYNEYTGLRSSTNKKLYAACHNYYKVHKEFPWNDPAKWSEICKRYGFSQKTN